MCFFLVVFNCFELIVTRLLTFDNSVWNFNTVFNRVKDLIKPKVKFTFYNRGNRVEMFKCIVRPLRYYNNHFLTKWDIKQVTTFYFATQF